MDILHPLAQLYAEKHSSPQDSLLQELEEYTRSHHPASHMISGFLQGRFLQLFSALLQPKAVLEIGTMTGYSALCLATGLAPTGELHTIEVREQDAAIAQSFLIALHWLPKFIFIAEMPVRFYQGYKKLGPGFY